MIDPITAVGLATSAFNILKQGISAGKDIQEMSGTLSKWGSAFSDFQYAEDKSKNPYKKQELLDNAINGVVGSAIFLTAAAGVVTGFYYLGKYQGKW